MANDHLMKMTAEERALNLEKARDARAAKVEAGKHLKQDWKDKALWAFLRSELKLRAPSDYIPCSERKYITRTLKAIGKDNMWYYDHFSSPMTKFAEDNQNVPAYVLQGLMLEAAYPELVAKFRNEDE